MQALRSQAALLAVTAMVAWQAWSLYTVNK